MRAKNLYRNILLTCLATSLTACGWFGGDDEEDTKKKVDGERISVLSFERRLEADPRLLGQKIILPRPYVNDTWTQPGGFADNVAHHLELGESIKRSFSVSMVSGSSRDIKITVPPIIAEDKIFALGADLRLVAANAETGKRLWRQKNSRRARVRLKTALVAALPMKTVLFMQ